MKNLTNVNSAFLRPSNIVFCSTIHICFFTRECFFIH
jgi:hypothetical protein